MNLSHKLSVYGQLFKIKLTVMVVISAIFGYFIGAENYSGMTILWLIIGGLAITSASSVFNQLLEKEYDAKMERTKIRPLPLGKMTKKEALFTGLFLGIGGVFVLWYCVNTLSGILGISAILTYVLVYTPLKRVSNISVLLGAFPGALPPMLGWVAATEKFTVAAGILFAIQFVWQFPHSFAIAWRLHEDYKKVGFKMLPCAEKNKKSAFLILLSSLVLFLVSPLPEYYSFAGRLTTIGCFVMSGLVVMSSFQLYKTLKDKYALHIMLYAYLYLMGSLTLILIDKFL